MKTKKHSLPLIMHFQAVFCTKRYSTSMLQERERIDYIQTNHQIPLIRTVNAMFPAIGSLRIGDRGES